MKAVSSICDKAQKLYPPEGRPFQSNDNVVTCWKCNCLNLIHDTWDYIECADCHALCKIPDEAKNQSKKKSSTSNKKVYCLYTLLTCPNCKTENKCLTSKKTMVCMACRYEFDILFPEEEPKEIDCDSLDPNSRYYKFQERFKKSPAYPPINSYPVSDLFFPDPAMLNWFPVNPLLNYYNQGYQELEELQRRRRTKELKERINKEYFGKSKLSSSDEVYLLENLKELDSKLNDAIMDGFNNRGYIYNYLDKMDKYNKNNSYLDNLNSEKNECFKKLFFQK